MFRVGQGLLGRVAFRDGGIPEYDRPYLIVYVSDTEIGLLNVSSVAGKESKLLYPTNRNIVKYNPPFRKSSFVKLDSLTYITYVEASAMRVLSGGLALDQHELNSIVASVSF